jgi:hypothetical protein
MSIFSDIGSFAGDLFAKKEGGTFVGNLIRTAASGATSGILGQGKDKINANGTIGNGDTSSTLSDILAAFTTVAAKTPAGRKVIDETGGKLVANTISNNIVWIAIIAIMGMFLIMGSRK